MTSGQPKSSTVFTTREPEEAAALAFNLDQFGRKSAWHRIRLRELGLVCQYGKGTQARLVQNLIERDGPDCCMCGRPIDPTMKDRDDPRSLTVEHFQARSTGGHDYLWNLGLAHKGCNNSQRPYAVDLALAFQKSLPFVRRAQDWLERHANGSTDWFSPAATGFPPVIGAGTPSQRLSATMSWLKSRGNREVIDTERKLYAAIARILGHDVPYGHLPGSRKLASRTIRHYARTGEFILLPLAEVEDVPAKSKKRIRKRLIECFEVGDVGESRPGLLQTAMDNNRPTRITLLFEEQDGLCHYCGEDMLLSKQFKDEPRFATLDHVHPKSQGGTRSAGNSVAACARCNSEKAHMAYHLFMAVKGGAA